METARGKQGSHIVLGILLVASALSINSLFHQFCQKLPFHSRMYLVLKFRLSIRLLVVRDTDCSAGEENFPIKSVENE